MSNDRPNVLVAITDDHAAWAMGHRGAPAHTPAMDHLARTGTRFDSAFCPTPVCSPARASFFTGLLPSQHGIHDHIGADHDGDGWLADTETLPELLADAGYETAISGKWHCGQPQQARKFEHSFGVRDENGYKEWYKTTEGDRRITDRALEQLRTRDRDRPYFGVVGYTQTHSSHDNAPERHARPHLEAGVTPPDDADHPFGRIHWSGEDPGQQRAHYLGTAEAIDTRLGRLLDELDRQGMREETIVVYTADHGLNVGAHGVLNKGNGTSPPNFLEESITVPLLVSGPGVDRGRRREPVDHTDTFETLCDLAGIESPDREGPGESYRRLLRGGPATDWREVQIGEYGPVRMARTAEHKLVRHGPGEGHRDYLVDLERDPRETTNRLDDAEYADVVDDLDDALAETFETRGLPHDGRGDLPEHNGGEAWTGWP